MIFDDLSKNPWFYDFSSADMQDIAVRWHVCARFLPIVGRSVSVRPHRFARDLDFLKKKAWISRYQLRSAHMATQWVRLWQIDRGHPIFGKNGDASERLWIISPVSSVRHRESCSKIIFHWQKSMILMISSVEKWYFSSVGILHPNCIKIYIWPLLDVENPNLQSNRRAMGWFSS